MGYKERIKEEHRQLITQLGRLSNILNKYELGTLGYEPSSPIELLKAQEKAMTDYADILEARAKFEDIDLD